MEALNRDKLDLEYYLGVISKWYLPMLISFALAVGVGIYLILFTQRYYESETIILVQPQKLPTDVVRNIVAEDINTRVSTLSQRIRSRTNLEKIIQDFDLFSGKESEGMYMEDKVNILRDRISVKMTNDRNRNADSFTVTYRGTDPVRVQQITQALASYIIDENLKLRETKVLVTNTFLGDELESMRLKLVSTETKLKEYREQFMGGLPEQLDSNLRILDSLNERMILVRDEIRSYRYRLDSFYQSETRYTDFPEDLDGVPDVANMDLESMREELDLRLKRYTKYHPDILQLQALIERLEQRRTIGESGPEGAVNRLVDTAYDRQRRNILAEIAINESEREKLQEQIAIYKKRVEDTPKREQELLSLQRDYDNIRSAYHSLLGRQLEAQIAVNMEKKQKGEQFRIIDHARVQQKPVHPDIKKMVVFVLAAGVGLGLGVVALLEFLMQTFRGARAVEAYTSIPVIASIPTIQGPGGFMKALLGGLVPVTSGVMALSLLGVFLGLAYIKG